MDKNGSNVECNANRVLVIHIQTIGNLRYDYYFVVVGIKLYSK